MVKPVDSLAMLKARGDEFCEPFKSAIKWIPDDTKYFESEITHWMPIGFDVMDGRITLAGDAAHPMAPSMKSPGLPFHCHIHHNTSTTQNMCPSGRGPSPLFYGVLSL